MSQGWGYWEYGYWHPEGNTSDLTPEYSQQPEQLGEKPMGYKMQSICKPGYEWSEYDHRCNLNTAGELTRAETRIYPDKERDHQMDPVEQAANHTMRQFSTGATRDTDVNKPDYKGYLSPLAIQHFGRYMLKHQKQADGTMRASDNWKKGIPIEEYFKSFIRHTVDAWAAHERGHWDEVEELMDAIWFNVQGILHEREKNR